MRRLGGDYPSNKIDYFVSYEKLLRAYREKDDIGFDKAMEEIRVSDKAVSAAKKIVDGYEYMNKMLPLAGGNPQPIEQSTDHAIVMALEILRLSYLEWQK